MSPLQNIKTRIALIRKAFELRRPLTESEMVAVAVEVLGEGKALLAAIGAIAVVWAEVELHLGFINGVLVLQEENADLKLPGPLQQRIDLFDQALRRVPQLAHLQQQGDKVIEALKRLKEVRHDIVHGVAIERLPDGARTFLRLKFAGQDINQRHANYSPQAILDAANEMRVLQGH